MKIKTIGKIQIIIGIILLVATIIWSIGIIQYDYLTIQKNNVNTITETWKDVANMTNGTDWSIMGHVIDAVTTQSTITHATIYLFGLCSAILLILAIMFILQGLVNLSINTNKK